MKVATTSLAKFKRIQRKLRLPLWQAVGILETLWWITGQNAPRGDVGRLSNEDIADLMEWQGDPDELVAVLVSARWLDESAAHRLLVHDWTEHAPSWIKAMLSRTGQTFAVEGLSSEPTGLVTSGLHQSALESPLRKDGPSKRSARKSALPLDLIPSDPLPSDPSALLSEKQQQQEQTGARGSDAGTQAARPPEVKPSDSEPESTPMDMRDAWNELAAFEGSPFARCHVRLGPKRTTACKRWLRTAGQDLALWRQLCETVARSTVLARLPRVCSKGLEWLVDLDNTAAVLSGRYADDWQEQPDPAARIGGEHPAPEPVQIPAELLEASRAAGQAMACGDGRALFTDLLAKLEPQLNAGTFRTWFGPLRYLGSLADRHYVEAPDLQAALWHRGALSEHWPAGWAVVVAAAALEAELSAGHAVLVPGAPTGEQVSV